MHDYNTILGVIELRLSKVSYDSVQKRYRIGRSGIALIMKHHTYRLEMNGINMRETE